MIEEPRFGARKDDDGSWSILDRRTGGTAQRSGLILAGLNEKAVLGLIRVLEEIEDAPKRVH